MPITMRKLKENKMPQTEGDRLLWIKHKKDQLGVLANKMTWLVTLRNRYAPARKGVRTRYVTFVYPFKGAKSLFKQNAVSMNATVKKIELLKSQIDFLSKVKIG